MSMRASAQVSGDPELAEDMKQTISFSQVDTACFSFRNLARIHNLTGLQQLVKLQLDNNRIQKIENLSHLVSTSPSMNPAAVLLSFLQQWLVNALEAPRAHCYRTSNSDPAPNWLHDSVGTLPSTPTP